LDTEDLIKLNSWYARDTEKFIIESNSWDTWNTENSTTIEPNLWDSRDTEKFTDNSWDTWDTEKSTMEHNSWDAWSEDDPDARKLDNGNSNIKKKKEKMFLYANSL